MEEEGACDASTGPVPYPTGKAEEGNTLAALLGPVNAVRVIEISITT